MFSLKKNLSQQTLIEEILLYLQLLVCHCFFAVAFPLWASRHFFLVSPVRVCPNREVIPMLI